MRDQIIRKYVEADHVYEIIWHDIWLYIWTAVKYTALIVLVGITYIFLIRPMWQSFLQSLWASIWVLIYGKLLFDIFDEYLDTLIVTDRWLVHFRWNWIRNQKVENLQRVSIESLSYEQNSLLDSIINKGDIKIKLEDVTTVFKDISDPALVSNKLLWFKDNILWRHNYMENETRHEPDNYNILVEALWEVVNEYIQNKKPDTYY